MMTASMRHNFATIGVNLSKNAFHLCAINAKGELIARERVPRAALAKPRSPITRPLCSFDSRKPLVRICMMNVSDLPLLSHSKIVAEFEAAAESEVPTRALAVVYRTRVMFNINERLEILNESCIGLTEGQILWHLARELKPKVIIETGFGRGTSAAFFLAAMSPWNGRLISIDPAFRHWAEDTGLMYIDQLGLANRHTLIEHPSEIALPTLLSQEKHETLRLSYIDGSHHFDGALIDFTYLDRLTEVGGIIAIDDAHSPALRTLASFVANNLPYRLHYPTRRLLLCQKTLEATREWCHFRPFHSSTRTDWDVHDDLPDAIAIPGANFGELA
jgi:predicted O-methyltransferase YrrM